MKRCAVVMQEGMVYSGSIISNIALSDENLTRNAVISL